MVVGKVWQFRGENAEATGTEGARERHQPRFVNTQMVTAVHDYDAWGIGSSDGSVETSPNGAAGDSERGRDYADSVRVVLRQAAVVVGILDAH